jgi:hypothetical protein
MIYERPTALWAGLFYKTLKQNMKENLEYQAGAALVDEGIRFDVPGIFTGKVSLEIKPLKPGTIARLGMLASKLEQIEESTVQELLRKGKNISVIAEMIAVAVINQQIFKKWKLKYYKWLLLNRVESMKYLYAYMNLVYRQMSAEHFFFIMALTNGMNHLKTKQTAQESTEAAKHSGEPSQSSRKPSD